MGFALFLLQDLGATFAKVGKMDETNCLRFKQIFC